MKKFFNNKYIYIPFAVILFLFIAYMTADVYFDNDGYWILSTGEYIINHGIPKINPFTFIPNLNIIIQQWPWAVYCYKIYSLFGNKGIYISALSLFLINVFLFSRIAKIKKADINLSVIFVLFIFTINYVFISIRPTMLTVLLLAMEIYILEYYKNTNKKCVLIVLVLLSLLEINIHSAIWFLHFVFLLPYIVPPIKNPFVLFKETSIKRMPIIITMIPMFLVGFINPYGINGMLYLFYSFGDKLKNAGISELGCWTLKDFYGILIISSVFLIFYICTKKKSKNIPIDSAAFYLFCGTTIMGCMYIRNLIYFVFGLIIITIELISQIDLKQFYSWIEKQNKYTCLSTWLIIFLAIGLLGKDTYTAINKSFDEINDNPIKIVKYLNDNDVNKESTKIYTEFNSGGYFEFKGYHCFIDARPELYFKSLNKKQDVFDDYMNVNHTSKVKNIEKFLDKYNFDYLCISSGTTFDIYMQTNNKYKMVEKDKNAGYKLYQKIN